MFGLKPSYEQIFWTVTIDINCPAYARNQQRQRRSEPRCLIVGFCPLNIKATASASVSVKGKSAATEMSLPQVELTCQQDGGILTGLEQAHVISKGGKKVNFPHSFDTSLSESENWSHHASKIQDIHGKLLDHPPTLQYCLVSYYD